MGISILYILCTLESPDEVDSMNVGIGFLEVCSPLDSFESLDDWINVGRGFPRVCPLLVPSEFGVGPKMNSRGLVSSTKNKEF